MDGDSDGETRRRPETRDAVAMTTYDAARLVSKLESAISGDVGSSPHHTRYYSVDSSSYAVRPDVVVIPRDVEDVSAAVRIAAETGAHITARGGGTGLVGGALNCGIILDMRNISRIRIVRLGPAGGSVEAEAGATRGRLDDVLGAADMMFGPNPSVGPFCTVGGMVANNAAGSRSLKYGATIDNVSGITIVDGTGGLVRLPEDADVAAGILDIARRVDRSGYPDVSKNSSGYRLDAVSSAADAHRVIAGSEGTLGVIISATIDVVRRPESRTLHILEYEAEQDAAADCLEIVGATRPSAAEFVDRTILDSIGGGFGSNVQCLLFVEYEGKDGASTGMPHAGGSGSDARKAAARGAVDNGEKGVASLARKSTRQTVITDELEISRWWRHRDSALHYSLITIDDDAEEVVPHVIEDAVVPLGALPELFAALRHIRRRHGARIVTYGHAGSGNIHARLVLKKGETGRLRRIAAEYFERVIALGGSTTAEHGDGLARSEFVEMQYGQENVRLFAELKGLLDPSNVMNPGKILTGGGGGSGGDATGALSENFQGG